MVVYRISKLKRARDLSGFGASLKGQRWNRRGTFLLYTAEHRSLASLEVMVHLGNDFPDVEYAIIAIEIPDDSILRIDSNILPKEWKKVFDPGILASFADEWLQKEKSIALGVPSAIIPQETNYLINPLHPDFHERVRIVGIEPFTFDERFFRDVI
ncbi:MAG: RES family NAD+ phosphorylase [Arcicella sp.]|nr:RES family NAD+ phosphorylase [Arcicella sp.]